MTSHHSLHTTSSVSHDHPQSLRDPRTDTSSFDVLFTITGGKKRKTWGEGAMTISKDKASVFCADQSVNIGAGKRFTKGQFVCGCKASSSSSTSGGNTAFQLMQRNNGVLDAGDIFEGNLFPGWIIQIEKVNHLHLSMSDAEAAFTFGEELPISAAAAEATAPVHKKRPRDVLSTCHPKETATLPTGNHHDDPLQQYDSNSHSNRTTTHHTLNNDCLFQQQQQPSPPRLVETQRPYAYPLGSSGETMTLPSSPTQQSLSHRYHRSGQSNTTVSSSALLVSSQPFSPSRAVSSPRSMLLYTENNERRTPHHVAGERQHEENDKTTPMDEKKADYSASTHFSGESRGDIMTNDNSLFSHQQQQQIIEEPATPNDNVVRIQQQRIYKWSSLPAVSSNTLPLSTASQRSNAQILELLRKAYPQFT